MNKIKVLHIHTLALISGSGIDTFLCMTKINSERYVSELACAPKGELIRWAQTSGIKVREIKHLVRPISIWHDLIAIFELVDLIKKEGYTIVHTHNSKAGFIGRLAAKLAGVGIVIHTVHGFSFHPYERLWRRKIFIFLEKLAATWCDRLITVSQYLIDWAIKERIVAKEKLVKIYSGIVLERFCVSMDIREKKRQLGIDEDGLVVLEVAKLWKGKGQDILLKAIPVVLKEVPQINFIFVGEGDEEAKLRALAKILKIEDKVIFAGFRRDIPEINAIADIACLPSLWEGLGRSVLEAMASGKPVVASKVGGIVDLVEDGVTGFLVSPADSQALAKALIRLLKDRDLRERMGQAGRRKVDARFSAQRMIEDIQNLYEELLKKKGLIQ